MGYHFFRSLLEYSINFLLQCTTLIRFIFDLRLPRLARSHYTRNLLLTRPLLTQVASQFPVYIAAVALVHLASDAALRHVQASALQHLSPVQFLNLIPIKPCPQPVGAGVMPIPLWQLLLQFVYSPYFVLIPQYLHLWLIRILVVIGERHPQHLRQIPASFVRP